MNVLQAAVLGIIQGLAEFLPISSSGHLEIAQRLMGLQADSMSMMLLTVLLHVGTLAAVIVVFWKDWIDILKNLREDSFFVKSFVGRKINDFS